MKRKVILSKRASHKLDVLFNYLQSNWSQNVKTSFIEKLDKKLEMIKENPEIFPKSNIIKGLHKCVITKQTTLYYLFDDFTISIVTIFFNKQNPNALMNEINKDD